jgi:O-antigen/teichoic acid export membrane protein
VILLALRTISGLGSLAEPIEILTDIDPALNPVSFLYVLLYIVSAVAIVALTIATVAGLIQGDRRFRKYFILAMAIRLAMALVNLAIDGAAHIFELIGIALFDGLMLLYFYKSKRVRTGYFPEAAAARKEKPAEDRVIDQGW